MTTSPLLEFLQNKMSMTEVYQPVVIKELLVRGGKCSKSEIALALARYDQSVLEYYRKVLMRWPKTTLVKHGVITYNRKGELFEISKECAGTLNFALEIQECENQIETWQRRRRIEDRSPESYISLRYKVLSRAKGKCELCGIPGYIRPLDVDHIIPQSKADKRKRVFKDGAWIYVHSEENLQSLCFKCNRNKKDSDQTDFRRVFSLVRDRAQSIEESTKDPKPQKVLRGHYLKEALREKVLECFEKDREGNANYKIESLVDAIEAIIDIAALDRINETELLTHLATKRTSLGSFLGGLLAETRIHRG